MRRSSSGKVGGEIPRPGESLEKRIRSVEREGGNKYERWLRRGKGLWGRA